MSQPGGRPVLPHGRCGGKGTGQESLPVVPSKQLEQGCGVGMCAAPGQGGQEGRVGWGGAQCRGSRWQQAICMENSVMYKIEGGQTKAMNGL